MNKRPSLRQCINDNCISCIYDHGAAGTWRQQVTLCSIKENCALYAVRPVTNAPIPTSVLDYYMVTGPEREFYLLSRPQEGPVTEYNDAEAYPSDGPA